MTEVTHVRPEFVTSFPTPMEPGVAYVSVEYNSCGHLCACGCGREVITPLSPVQWSFAYDGENISIRPSIGNWTLPCRSHYVVDRGKVRWARDFTEDEVAWNRLRDRALLDGSYSDDESLLDWSVDEPDPRKGEGEPHVRRDGAWKRMIRRLGDLVR
jgi:hypothetical protein